MPTPIEDLLLEDIRSAVGLDNRQIAVETYKIYTEALLNNNRIIEVIHYMQKEKD